MKDTNKAFGAAVLLAVILIYLILAALYESIIQPFIIMISMPLSFYRSYGCTIFKWQFF